MPSQEGLPMSPAKGRNVAKLEVKRYFPNAKFFR